MFIKNKACLTGAVSLGICLGLGVFPAISFADAPAAIIKSAESTNIQQLYFDGATNALSNGVLSNEDDRALSSVSDAGSGEDANRNNSNLPAVDKSDVESAPNDSATSDVTNESLESNTDQPASEPTPSPDPAPAPTPTPKISDFAPADIEEGVYEISNKGSNKLLDVVGGSTSSGANTQQYGKNNTSAQRWRIEKHNGHYLLINVGSGKALDVSSGIAKSGSNVQQYDVNYTNAQLWDFVARQEGGYFLKSCLGDFVLDISGGSSSNGGNAQIYSWNSTNAQVWNLIKISRSIEDGLYRVGSMLNGNQVMDVQSGSIDNCAKSQLYTSNNTLAQYWTFTYNEKTGYYTVRSAVSGKVLDCRSGGTSNGTAVQQYGENGTSAQWWRVVQNADGSISLFSAKSGLALDVPGGNASNGSGLQLYAPNGTNSQKWALSVPTVFIQDGLYEIRSRVDNNCLIDVSGGSKSDDAKIQIWDRNGTLAQKWSVSVCDDGSVLIKSANSGKYLSADGTRLMSFSSVVEGSHWIPKVSSKGGLILVNSVTGSVLDLSGASNASGTALQLYGNNGTAAQAWRFLVTNLLDSGYYTIANQARWNNVLDVAGGSGASGAHVQLYGFNGTSAQKWYVKSLGNGVYSFTAFVSNKVLDVLNGDAHNGSTIQQWDANGSNAQRWILKVGEHGGIVISSALANGSFALYDGGSGLTLSNGSDRQTWRFDGTTVCEQTFASANGTQQRLVNIAKSTPTPGANLCSAWVSMVFSRAGYGYEYGDACDLYWRYCNNSNRADLKVGMIIAVPSHSHNYAGSRWGHIAIYIGDGMIIENIGRVNVQPLQNWLNYYGTTYTPKWGWYRNTALC